MRVAIVCSAHGFGHVTRQLELAGRLRALGLTPVLLSAAPAPLIEAWGPGLEHHPCVADVGLVQSDSITEDIDATARRLAECCSDAAVDALSARLRTLAIDRVVADAPPTALEAARRAGLPALAVGNFTWPWIYAHYPRLRGWAARLARWQSAHPALSLWPGPGMMGFRSVTPVGLVGRRTPPAERLAPRAGHVLVSFGGFGLDALDARLPTLPGVTWVTAPPMVALDRPDACSISGVGYPALVGAVDLVLTKPGYGILAESILAGTRVVWIPRGAFPEASSLTDVLAARGDRPVDVDPDAPPAVWRDAIAAAVEARLSEPAPEPARTSDSADAATLIHRWATHPARHR